MKCNHRRYFEKDGELRSLPPCPHSHLNTVSITGFYGRKDQLELTLHILRNAAVLKAMKIVSRAKALEPGEWHVGSPQRSADGYRAALEFVRKEDHTNVVDILDYMEAS
uniref:Uncharacterized protein n=1 Tax=Arundo donax TaxID=35708 RepID=A0A0A8ZPZ8_ARUDO